MQKQFTIKKTINEQGNTKNWFNKGIKKKNLKNKL